MICRFWILALFLFAYSCSEDQPKTPAQLTNNYSPKELKQKIVAANKMYIKRESDEIDQYIKLRSWEMITTGTGLRYMIIKYPQ